MKKTQFCIFIFIVFCFCNCKEELPNNQKNTQNSLEQFHWLLGNWKVIKKDGEYTENWSKRKKTLFGCSFLRQNFRLTFKEMIVLKYVNDTLNYVVTFDNQRDSTFFKATTVKDSILIFENPKNDFPKKIKYELISKDKIKASIHGDDNKSETFDFSRGR
jgi:Domain of unknown function (DUF6265)